MSTQLISLPQGAAGANRQLYARFRQTTGLDRNHPAVRAARPSCICPQLQRADITKKGQAWYALSQEAAEAYYQTAQNVFTLKTGSSVPVALWAAKGERASGDLSHPSQVLEVFVQPEPETASVEFTFAMAYDLFRSEDPFPVDLEDVIAWGLSEARETYHARRSLKSLVLDNFIPGLDFLDDRRGTPGRPIETMKLTVQCFKELCLIAQTPKGKASRLYVIEAVRPWRPTGQHQLQSIRRQDQPPKLQSYVLGLDLIAQVLMEAEVEPALIAQWKLNQYAQFEPELRESVKGAQSLFAPAATCRIGAIHPVQNTLLSPTEISEELSQRAGHRIKPQMVNNLLVDLGLATRVGKDKRIALTEEGKAQGGVATLASSESNGWNGAWVKWPAEIVEHLAQYLPTQSIERTRC